MKKTKSQNLWTLICKKAIVDKETNLISIIEILEKFVIDIDMNKAPEHIVQTIENSDPKNPLQVGGEMVVASHWSIEEKYEGEEISVFTTIKDANSEILGKAEFSFVTQKGDGKHRTFLKLPSFPVTSAGVYTINTTLKDKDDNVVTKSTLPITVEINDIS